jgi:signal transduction histidine kinase
LVDEAASVTNSPSLAPEQGILKSIIVPLAAAIVSLLLAVVIGVHWLIETEDRAQVGRIVNVAANLLHVQVDEEEETMKIGLAGVLGNQAFAAPLRAGDRAELLRLARPVYDAMRHDGQVTHFYFGTAEGITLLRVHAPASLGGRHDHGLTIKASLLGAEEAGLDLGGLGALSLRVAAPYRDNGKVIGFVELGVEFRHIANAVHEILGVDLLTLIDKRRLDRQAWERGRDIFGWLLPWDQFPNVVMNNNTMAAAPAQLLQRIAEAPSDGNVAAGYVTADGRILYLAPLPLLDSSGERLGSMVVVVDRTSLITGSRILMGAIALLCLALAVLLLVRFHRIVGKVEQRIGKSIARLARANADLERVAYVACHELQEPLDQLMTSSLLLERDCTQLGAENARHLRFVAEGARRLEHTVGTLEDYLDLDVNARRIEPVVLDAVLAAALEKIQPLAGNDRVTAMPLPIVAGRPVLLARAFYCILDCALKARQPGHPLHLQVWAEGQDGNWQIWFAGMPWPPDVIETNLEDRIELTIARRVAQLHGGDLGIVSMPRYGTAVLVRLCSTADIRPDTRHPL